MRIKTVKVVADTKSGFIIINEIDLTDKHKIYERQSVKHKSSKKHK